MDRYSAKSGFLPGIFNKRHKRHNTGATSSQETGQKMEGPKPSAFLMRIPNGPRNHFVAMAGEFVGTFLFLFFAFAGTQVANTPQTSSGSQSTTLPQGPNPAQLLYISLAFSFSLAVNAWIFYRVSGGLFNPAVTLALCLVGALPFARGGLVCIAQILGAMASAGVVTALFPGPLAVTTSLSGGTSLAQGLFIEMFLTAGLIITIIMLAVEKHKGSFLAPVGIGLSLFIAELAGVYYTGGSLNPARSFGPCVASRQFPHEHWIYWVGPALGALVASGFYWFIKSCEYETVNPGQDFDDLEANAYNPEKDLSRPVVSPTHVRTGSSLEPEEAAREGKQITTTPFAPLELPIGEETIADGVQPGSDTTAGSHLATTPSPGEHTNTRATGARQIDSNAAVDSRSSTLGKDANRLSSNSRPGTGGRDAIQSRGSTVHDRTTVV